MDHRIMLQSQWQPIIYEMGRGDKKKGGKLSRRPTKCLVMGQRRKIGQNGTRRFP